MSLFIATSKIFEALVWPTTITTFAGKVSVDVFFIKTGISRNTEQVDHHISLN